MKYIIIDDKEQFANQICGAFTGESEVVSPEGHELNGFTDKIIWGDKEKIDANKISENIVLFINVNLVSKKKRQEQEGIELLIWLRIKNTINHVVLYSFETLHSLLNRNPKHLIATSRGTSFVQLPNNFKKAEEILTMEIGNGKNKFLVEEWNLRQTLRAAFDNTGLQHRLANIYGLWFMFNTHNNNFPQEKLGINIFSQEFLQNFDILQLHIANFLIRKGDNENSTQELLEKIGTLREKIKNRNPKILYIDDKADTGWAAFLKKATYGNASAKNFKSLTPDKTAFKDELSINTFFQDVKAKILNNGQFIDCLFLDLRLADETGDLDDIDNLSGIRLLTKIHQTFPSLPVIMFTASNKAKSVKKVIACGAEGLWTKPGLDELKTNQHYLESYFELLTYLNDALNKYATDTEKFIVDAQFQVEIIEESDSYPNELVNIDIILTDTNFWCNHKKDLVNNHKSARKILNIASSIKRKRFVVIGDVFDELFRNTQKKDKDSENQDDGTVKEIDNIPLKISAKYGLDVLNKYKEDKFIETDYSSIRFVIDSSIEFDVKAAKGGQGFNVISIVEKNHSYHKTKEPAEAEKTQRNASKYGSLHADDTYQMLIPYYIGKPSSQNILFITDDFGGPQKKGGVPAVINALRLKFGYWRFGNIPTTFIKEKHLLKFEAYGKYCLIAHSKVFHKICFPDGGNSIRVISIPNTP